MNRKIDRNQNYAMQRRSPKMGTEVSYNDLPFNVRVFPRTTYKYSIELFDYLERMSDISDAIHLLAHAEENDEVEIHLSSGGGSLDVAQTLIHAIRKCSSPVHIVASGKIASAATLILLEAGSFELAEGTTFLFHAASYGAHGSMTDMKSRVIFDNEQLTKLLHNAYRYFFTQEEIDIELIKNKREWDMDADEFMQRFHQRNKLLEQDQFLEYLSQTQPNLSEKKRQQMLKEHMKQKEMMQGLQDMQF